jgi:hypothetical protein
VEAEWVQEDGEPDVWGGIAVIAFRAATRNLTRNPLNERKIRRMKSFSDFFGGLCGFEKKCLTLQRESFLCIKK